MEQNLMIEKYILEAGNYVKEKTGLTPSQNQIKASLYMYQGKAIEMPTGDGKTLSALITIIAWLKHTDKKITHITCNDYLSVRDYMFMKPVIESLGKKAIMIDAIKNTEELKSADVIFSSGVRCINHYLSQCNSNELPYHTDYILIDELDTVLIDQAQSQITIADSLYINKDMLEGVACAASKYEVLNNKSLNAILNEINITEEEYFANKYNIQEMIADYFESKKVVENKNYIIDKGKIVLIDSLGRRLDSHFPMFIQSFVEYRHNFELSRVMEPLFGLTFEGFIRDFELVAGMSGTLQGEEKYLDEHYNLQLEIIEPTFKSQREIRDDIVINGENKSFAINIISEEIVNYHKKHNPILLFCTSIEQSEDISEALKERQIKHTLLNAKNASEENEVIANAGKKDAITIITTMAGRGTDIVVDKEFRDDGGLIILSAGHMATKRLDDQLIGRCARRGDAGTVQFFYILNNNNSEDKMILNTIQIVNQGKFDEFAKERLNKSVRKALNNKQSENDKREHEVRDERYCYYSSFDHNFMYAQRYKGLSENKLSDTMRCLGAIKDNAINEQNHQRNEYINKVVSADYKKLLSIWNNIKMFQFNTMDSLIAFKKMANKDFKDLKIDLESVDFKTFVSGLDSK